jgi:hypothetical protein
LGGMAMMEKIEGFKKALCVNNSWRDSIWNKL